MAKLAVDFGGGDFAVVSVSIANCKLASFRSVVPDKKEDKTCQAAHILKMADYTKCMAHPSTSPNNPISSGFGDSKLNTAYCLAFRILPARSYLLPRFRLGSDYGGVEVK